jgi:hypothetical protein
LHIFEQITALASVLYDKDQVLISHLKNSLSFKPVKNEVKMLKRNLINLKRVYLENSRKVMKDLKNISLILKEYKERCRASFVDFLKQLEIDLRKTLKPLVSDDVLLEEVNFKPICMDPELLSSYRSDQDAFADRPGDTTEDKLNNHIQLLVHTLETVAKSLINVAQNTYTAYYELVDPKMLYSDPPSPLAAPLPEYFSYDLGNLSDENRKKKCISLSAVHKEKIIQKFTSLQLSNTQHLLFKSRKFQEKLENLLKNNPKDEQLLAFFEEEGIPVSEREKLVYEVINSIRSEGVHVKLEDMIEEVEKNSPAEAKTFILSHFSRVEAVNSKEFLLETFVEDKRCDDRPQGKKIDVPRLNLKKDDSKVLQRRCSTPSKHKKDLKQGKRTKTPVNKKQKNVKF